MISFNKERPSLLKDACLPNDCALILDNGREIPVSRSREKELRKQ